MANSRCVPCVECDASIAKVIRMYTHEHYCGRYCLSEGQLKHTRLILRMRAEEVHDGEPLLSM